MAIICSGFCTAFVNDQNTGVEFKCKFNIAKRVIRISEKHYCKRKADALKNAVNLNLVTAENYQNGYYDFYLKDANNNIFKFSYHAGGMSNNLDNGYFFNKQNF